MQRIWLQSDGDKLKALRESSGLEPVELARSVTLTPAHIRQLEDGGDSMFYSPAIKLSVGRRLLRKLGSDLDPVEDAVQAVEPESPGAAVFETPFTSAEPAVAETAVSDIERLRAATVLNPLARWFPAAAATAAVAVVGVVLYQVIKPWPAPTAPTPEVARAVTPVAAAPVQQETQALQVNEESAAPASRAIQSGQAQTQASRPARETPVAANCTQAPLDAVALQPPSSTKPANYVHLVATQEATLCVVDGTSRVTTVHLKPGDSRSIYGAAPWRIHSPVLAAVDVYFQGHRMTGSIGTATNVVFTEHASNTLN